MTTEERTPLLQRASSASETALPNQRTWIIRIGSALLAIGIIATCYVLWDWGAASHEERLSFEELQHLMITTPDPEQIRNTSSYYTSGPHLAGTNLSQVLWTKDLWASFGVESQVVSYDVYLNRPVDHALTLLRRLDGDPSVEDTDTKVIYKAKLAEDCLEEDPPSCDPRRIPTFHGYSASGDVTAQYVYVNYGTSEDYDDLIKANISLKGKIAVAKYDKVWRGMKVMRAQQYGMVAAVLYTDPGEDVFREEDGDLPYPNGNARQPSNVQRGSVLSINWQPGDPSTPGWPSIPGADRIGPEDMIGLPKIPSLPISYEDAAPLLEALNGYGPHATSVGKNWKIGGLGHRGVKYYVGPSPSELVLRVVNTQSYEMTPIYNLVGIINGTEDGAVILGNHHDSWTLGGAGDPHSGSSALNEIVRSFGKALKTGWKPRRTLVFARWDAEEYGMTGSTEWVEEYLPWLAKAGVAYLNADPGVTGSELRVNAVPLLYDLLHRTASLVLSPNQTKPGQTLADLWRTGIGNLGGGSDYSGFLDHAGVVAADITFRPEDDAPPYYYHSNYDSMTYMETVIDPGFVYHKALAQFWGLVAAELADALIIPFKATDYAIALKHYAKGIQDLQDELYHSDHSKHKFDDLRSAADNSYQAATMFDEKVSNMGRVSVSGEEARVANRKMRKLERQFLHKEGLDHRPWFKHVVFAPGYWLGYQGVVFPALREHVEAKDDKGILRWEEIIVKALHRAEELLRE